MKILGACCVAILALLLAATPASAQNLDSRGKDFWLAFPNNFSGGGAVATLFITGDAGTTGAVNVPGLGFSQSFTVTPGAVTSVELPANIFLALSSTVENKGIHVTAGKEISVYGLNRLQYTTDAYLALPTDILGTEYINLGYVNNFSWSGTQFGIVAAQNGTTVTITPTVTTDGHNAGVAYSVTLNQGQTYYLKNQGPNNSDLSGTIIKSTKPIAVFGGNECANIPPEQTACDHVVEQLPPTSAWGKNFVTVPLKTRLNGDTFRFLASNNNTTVRVNGTVVTTLNRGQYFETILADASQVTATQPILVAQYSNGSSYDNVTSDPFMMLIPPYEQFLGNYTITTPASGFAQNFANIVAPKAAVGSIRLDGTVIPGSAFSPIGSTGFSGAQIDLTLGAHTINGTTLPFGVFVYGFDTYDSYGYPGGESVSAVATVTKLSIKLEDGGGGVGGEKCFNGNVLDQDGKPVSGVRVDFLIKGANPAGSGFANTNTSGIAQYCYTGTNTGKDTIIGSVGDVADTAYYEWKKEVCGNGKDDDGDGQTDEDCPSTKTWYKDGDGDSYGNANVSKTADTKPAGYVADKTDCDDADKNVHPGATEICNGKDDNCDGQADEGVAKTAWYPDRDGDGYGNGDTTATKTCEDLSKYGYITDHTDCDDSDAAVHPGAAEVCGDGKDNDCNGKIDDCATTTLWYKDADSDGYGDPASFVSADTQPKGYVAQKGDCNDHNAAIHPGARGRCNGIDDDCDGLIDEDCTGTVWYRDADGDGFGDPASTTRYPTQPNGYVSNKLDCNDKNKTKGGPEVCDGLDNDCDGIIDNGLEQHTFYSDFDGDGYGSSKRTITACSAPPRFVAVSGDCNDDNNTVYPGAPELCDGRDNDCNGTIDDGLTLKPFYWDGDKDGYGFVRPVYACAAPRGYISVGGDFNDKDPNIHPGAVEHCDGVDEDCDGVIDNGFAQKRFYKDQDGDGWGSNSNLMAGCAPKGYVEQSGDCNDNNAAIHPGAAEVPGNGADDNCNGQVDETALTVTTRSKTGAPAEAATANTLQLSATPNPAQHYFTLHIQSNSQKPVQLRIVDAVGRVVEVRQGVAANSTLAIGHRYRSGTYTAQVLQEGKQISLKLVKQAE